MPYKNEEDRKAQSVRYYQINKEHIKEQANKNYAENCEARLLQRKKYREKNREVLLAKKKQYREENPEKIAESLRRNYLVHKKERLEYAKQYFKTLRGKEAKNKIEAKRRELGFVPINEPFEGCEGHHVNKEHVVYIPREIHQSIRHNVFTWHNMDAINTLVLPYINS